MDKMMSLYEFLGKAAGTELGKKVYLASLEGGWKHDTRKVSNPKYTGNVMLYPEPFLKEYFKPKEDLPF
jgi:hypothetical protein